MPPEKKENGKMHVGSGHQDEWWINGTDTWQNHKNAGIETETRIYNFSQHTVAELQRGKKERHPR